MSQPSSNSWQLDLRDFQSKDAVVEFAQWLQPEETHPPSVYLRDEFRRLFGPNEEAWAVIHQDLSLERLWKLSATERERLDAGLGRVLVDALNAILANSQLYEPGRFANVTLRDETKRLLSTKPTGEDLCWLNRLLLEDVYSILRKKRYDGRWVIYKPRSRRGDSDWREGFFHTTGVDL